MQACEHCGAENDHTRVFCGNCGTRLPEGSADSPAGSAPIVGSAPPLPGASVPKKPALKKRAPATERTLIGFLISNLLWLAIVSATLAAVVQMVRAPDNIPSVVGANTGAARETFATLKEVSESTKPIHWIVNAASINQYLETTIAMNSGEASALRAKFLRCFVILGNGNFSLGIDQQFLETHLYFLLKLEPVMAGTGMGARPVAGSIGRLPIHPSLLPAFQRLFKPTVEGLQPALKLLQRAKGIKLTPNDATLQWPDTKSSSDL